MTLVEDISYVNNNDYGELKLDISAFVGLHNLISKSLNKLLDITNTVDEQNTFLLQDEEISLTNQDYLSIEKNSKEINLVSDNRLELLIRKYSAAPNKDESIRLKMLTEKMKVLSPIVSEIESNFISSFTDTFSEISDREKKRKKFLDNL